MRQPDIAARQFGAAASDYLTSAVHATGPDLDDLVARFKARRVANVLDLGCGAGHVSYAVAPHVDAVCAYDVSSEMIAVVRQSASERGLNNIRTQVGAAEQLPFAAETFDAVVTRMSAHHWRDVLAALHEIHRVVKPGGVVIVIDSAGADDPLCDTHLQTIELLRDRSHVRNYTTSWWQRHMSMVGLTPEESGSWRISLGFAGWIARMRTPHERAAAILHVWQQAPEEVRQYYRVQADGSFELEVLRVVARRVAT